MKIRNLFITIATLFLFISTSNAQFFVLKTVEEFENHYGVSCLTASDWYNKYDVVDWKVVFEEEKEYKVLDEKDELWICNENNPISTSWLIKTTSMEITSIDMYATSKLSQSEQSEYDYIKSNLDSEYLDYSNNFLAKYSNLVEGYSFGTKNRVNNLVLDKLDELLFEIIMDYPQDVSLPEEVNNKYLTLKLIKLELMK